MGLAEGGTGERRRGGGEGQRNGTSGRPAGVGSLSGWGNEGEGEAAAVGGAGGGNRGVSGRGGRPIGQDFGRDRSQSHTHSSGTSLIYEMQNNFPQA